MKVKLAALVIATACILAWSRPMLAHHGSSEYDTTKVVPLKGTVTNYAMVNPHSTVVIDVKDESGNVQSWSFEFGPVRILKEDGWTKDILKNGDVVTAYCNPAKNGSHIGLLKKLVTPDGRTLKGL